MKRYQFTGHLSPLPPGVRLPIELSGEVYLVGEVDAEMLLREQRSQAEIARLNAKVSNLTDKLHRSGYRKKLRAPNEATE